MKRCSGVFRAIACAACAATIAACGDDRPPDPSSAPAPAAVDADPDIASARDSSVPDMPGSTEPPATAQPGEDVITADGWGPLRIGMTRADIVEAAGEDADPEAVGGPDPASCDQFRPGRAPPGLLVMVERGILTRISIGGNTGISTPEGMGVGDAGSKVLNMYGSRAIVEPHAYWPSPAKYVTVWRETETSGERRGIRFEIDANDRIVHIHAGNGAIEYVEGCV